MTSDDSMYRAPESSLERETDGTNRSLDDAIEGRFDFVIGDIMREAWDLLSGSKAVILGAMAISFGISAVTNVVSVALEDSTSMLLQTVNVAVSIGGTVIVYPINAGIYVYAIKRAAADESASFDDIFSCFSDFWPIIGLSILQLIFIFFGILALVLPGIYLAMAYSMAMPLLVVRRLTIWDSMETSRKALTTCWFRLFGLAMAVGLIVIIGGSLTLGIGFIWLLPFATLCFGVGYRNVFGYSATTS